MADSSSTNLRLFSATIQSKLKILLCTNMKLMLSLLLISLTLSTLLQLNSSSLTTSFIFESFIIPYPAHTTTDSYFININFSISNYDIEVIRNIMIFVSLTYILSYLITVVIIYSLNAIYMNDQLRLREHIAGVMKSLLASFSTKLYITIIDLSYNFSTVSLVSFLRSQLDDSQLRIMFFPLVIMFLVIYVLYFYIRSVLVLGLIASVTEKSFGVSALRSAMKIVKGRERYAYLFSWTSYIMLAAIAYYTKEIALDESKVFVARVAMKIVAVIVYAMVGILLVALHMAFYYECKKQYEDEEMGIKEEHEYTSLIDNDSSARSVTLVS